MYQFDPEVIQVGISSCLLGQEVRFDGGHKRHHFSADILSKHVRFVPVCPEMAIGLDAPRASIRLVGDEQSEVRAVSSDGKDVTESMQSFARDTASGFDYLSGYVLCAKSPSCGMERVRIYTASGQSCKRDGIGLYAAELINHHPNLPLEENGRLNDQELRENFITRLYAYHDWQCLLHQGLSAARLIDFHSRYKFMLMAHHPQTYSDLGQLLADLSSDLESKADEYIGAFMRALKKVASRRQQCNVLQHIQGYFKDQLNSRQRQELASVIERYRLGELPLMAPITLLRHYQEEYPNDYIAQQKYLDPHPPELALRYAL